MNKLNSLPERALDLVGSVGDGIRQAVPNSAIKWVETGAALAALRTGTRLAGTFVKRNPAVAAAAAVGAGLLWYVARRQAKRAQQNGQGTIEGSSRRVDAKRASRPATRKRSTRSRTTASE